MQVLMVYGGGIWWIALLPREVIGVILLHVRLLADVAHIHKILMDLFVFLEGGWDMIYMLDGLRRSFSNF